MARALIAAAVGIAAPASGAGASRPAAAEAVAGSEARVVLQSPAGAGAASAAVEEVGGRVTRRLDLVSGVSAVVPEAALPALSAAGLGVTRDRRVTVQGGAASGSTRSVHRQAVGADALHAAGHTGQGTTVALVDTGVSAVPDLAGRLVAVPDDLTGRPAECVNFSGESGCGDSYGHGTFMAGIIAGSGAASGGAYAGVAPGARVLSVKVAGRDGASDVSTVLAAVQWVVSHKDRHGIRVLNLSLGTDSAQSYRSDPLNYAVERAWQAGIAVVVAAANLGPAPGTVAKPADDPWVITVGAVDDRGTPALADDHLPDFSSRGPTASDGLAKPDVVAPGAHIVSLVAPGSAIEGAIPTAMTGGYRRGSGTSMATAVVSGLSAALLGADPALTPDGLKHALAATAAPTASSDPMEVGAGIVQGPAALAAPRGTANQGLERSSGLGALDPSRGTTRVRTAGLLGLPGVVLTGSQTAQLLLWDPVGFTTGDWTQSTWCVSPLALGWRSVGWEGSKWQGSKWQGSKWQGVADPTTHYGSKWQGSAWYGAWG